MSAEDPRKDLPAPTAPNFGARVREEVMRYMGRMGNKLDRGVTVRDLVAAGMVTLRASFDGGVPTGPGGPLTPGPAIPTPAEVDLTPPPTPTGLTVTAGLTFLTITSDPQVYTAGHGHDRTLLYGVAGLAANTAAVTIAAPAVVTLAAAPQTNQKITFTTTGALPTGLSVATTYYAVNCSGLTTQLALTPGGAAINTSGSQSGVHTAAYAPVFSDAVLLAEFEGNVYAHPTVLGIQWHIWAKWRSVDGVASVNPAGGTNGVVATTGKIGNVDLGPLIIEAGNLADGAVELSKFGAGIEPITIVASGPLPTVKSTETIVWDGKLYRWDGAAYVATVPAADITGALADAQLAAIAASKITGTMTDAQIAEVAAAKVSGQLTDAQLSAIAATKITGQLSNAQITSIDATKLTSQITSTQITDGAISTAKLAAGSVSTANLAAGAVTAGEIAAGAITTAKLAAGAVTANELAAGSVVAGKIAAAAITATELAAASVTTAKLAAGAVTADTIAANAVTAAKIETGSITTAKIVAGAVTAGEIAAGAVTTAKLAAGAVTANEIAANTITAAKIQAGTLTATELAANSVTAAKIAANAIAVGTAAIQNGAIVNAMIGNAAIDDAKIANLAASKILSGSIAVGQYIQSSGYVAGSAGWSINGNGTAEFSGVIVRGTIHASAGTIGSAAIGSNYVQSTNYSAGSAGWKLQSDGTAYFNTINARGELNGGAYTGYAWPAAGGTGFHISPTGLLLGNFNNGRFFQVNAEGDVYAPNFSIVNGVATFSGALSAATGNFSGTLTASAVNAVNTINLAGNAVTVPQSAYTVGPIYANGGGEAQSLTVTSSGQPALLVFGAHIYSDQIPNLTMKLVRDTVTVFQAGPQSAQTGSALNGGGMETATVIDTPTAGQHTYRLFVTNSSGAFTIAHSRCISYLEVKR